MTIEQGAEPGQLGPAREHAARLWLRCVGQLVANHWSVFNIAGATEIRALSNTLCDLYDFLIPHQLAEVRRDVEALSRSEGNVLAKAAGALAEFAARHRIGDEELRPDQPVPTQQDWAELGVHFSDCEEEEDEHAMG